MLFNSLSYVIFLPIVFALYWVIPVRRRWIVLLIASYYFYMGWNAAYLSLILFTTLVSYGAALALEKAESRRMKNGVLLLALTACLGVLFIFKYFNFFSDILSHAFRFVGLRVHPVTLRLVLPVGISFYTFQTLSYVADVYKGKIRAERHLGIYATFISFFPQLVAGPIERAQDLLPQIQNGRPFRYEQAVSGLKIMIWGYFKKMVIADNLAAYADAIYNNVFQYRGFSLLLGTLFFTFQIYCDFSGYSDIARGSAKLLGIELTQNFKSPYFSTSVKEFWRRWHISLSSWFRDYVYIPLGGNRGGALKRFRNLMATFLVSGLWHGADWSFVAWGGGRTDWLRRWNL